MSILASTEISFLPDWFSVIWRSVNFIACFALGTVWASNLIDAARGKIFPPAYSVWGQAALLLYAARVVTIQYENWNTPLTIEGAPWNSAILFCAAMNVILIRRMGRR